MTGSALMDTYRRAPVDLMEGQGSILLDASGRRYVDLVGGIAVCAVGHCHPDVVAAIRTQAGRLVHVSNLYGTLPQRRLADRLAELTGGYRSFLSNSGAEAIECALKLVRKWGREEGRWRVVVASGSFHGRTFGALAATAQPAKQEPFAPMLEGFDVVAFGDADALGAALGPETAAVLLEPIQGESGVLLPPAGYLNRVRELCDAAGVLLVLDEIQTGLGRTGAWFAAQHEGVEPDVVCLAKALGGGLPIGACLARPGVDVLRPGDHASTFGGGPVPCAAATAVLDVIDRDGLVERSGVLGAEVTARLTAALPGVTARGRGMLIALEAPVPVAPEIAATCLARGVLVNDVTPTVVRLAPALNIPDAELDEALTVVVEVTGEAIADAR